MSDLPLQDEQLLDVVRLNLVAGIGPRMHQALLECFGSASTVLAANSKELQQVSGVGAKLASSIVEARNSDAAERELDRSRQLGVQLLMRDDSHYPRMLTEICDAPTVLYCRGTLESRDNLGIALVGSRRCSVYGRQQAERLAGALARAGMTIVSGMARGIDAVAHRAALTAGGRTIAVAATGLAQVYPPEHKDLANEIAANGAVVSESHLEQPPVAGLFPQRNRIISGLSVGVIIVEATRNSGALHTARHAMEQGREVMAVPGRVDILSSEGCHDLIRDGVTLVRHANDVLEALGPLVEPVKQTGQTAVLNPRELTLNDQERHILNLISNEPKLIDQILHDANLDSSRVLSTLTVLEMKRMIRRLPGGLLIRASH